VEPAAVPESSVERKTRLTRTIESEIIPRLMLAHGVLRPIGPGRAPSPILQAHIESLARLVLSRDLLPASSYVNGLRQTGVPLEAIFLDLFAPAARHLGELWTADICDFMEVTLGLSQLQQLLRDIAPIFEAEGELPDGGRRVLLLPMPGEQHTFGLSVVEEFFRRAGWDVHLGQVETEAELCAFVRSTWFGVIGLSLSGDKLLDRLAPVIRSVRRDSANSDVGVIVGGQIFADRPELVARVGADATATDAPDAVVQAQKLLALVANRC
jgi:methanogenic corrinoid protein MtbC1